MSDKNELDKIREHLRVAKEQVQHVTGEFERHVMYSLIWSLESVLALLELRSVS